MNQTAKFNSNATGDAIQVAYLAIEQQPRDEAEKHLLEQARRHVQAHAHQVDLRDLAPAVREVMGDAYQVGCGSAHIWIKRVQDAPDQPAPERLAVIADQLTTAYRDWSDTKASTHTAP
jgi:hypothetical protein